MKHHKRQASGNICNIELTALVISTRRTVSADPLAIKFETPGEHFFPAQLN
jgi:hypothetical protein